MRPARRAAERFQRLHLQRMCKASFSGWGRVGRLVSDVEEAGWAEGQERKVARQVMMAVWVARVPSAALTAVFEVG